MNYMAKGPPTKDQPQNSGGRPLGQTPAGVAPPQIDPTNAYQQTQQQLLTSIQQQIYIQQAAGQVLAHAQSWGALTQQQTVSTNVPSLASTQLTQVPALAAPQNQGNALYPLAQQQQQQQQPNITISRVPATPTSVPPAVTPINQSGSGQIPVTQPLAPTTTSPATQNNTPVQLGTPAKPVNVQSTSPPNTQTKVSTTPVSNNVPALAPITQTPPKPQVQASLVTKPVETLKNPSVSPTTKPTPGKESVLPPRPISHQNTSSMSIVQKTPTKSTLKLATVSPRIKTTPKKSPPTPVAAPLQRSPIVPSPNVVASNTTPSASERPNALINKPKEASKPVVATPVPAKQEQKVPIPVKMTPDAKTLPLVNSVGDSNNVTPPTSVPTNNVTPPKKDVPEMKKITPVKDPVKVPEPSKKEQPETPKVPPTVEKSVVAKASNESTEKSPVKDIKEKVQKVLEKKEQAKIETPIKKSAATTITKAKPERKPAQSIPKEPKPSTSQGPDGSTGRTRRARKGVQPFQSPIPEIENAKKASINQGTSTKNKESSEKLIIFYKNEFLAVRNADGGFYICQAVANVTRKGQRINIRWFNEEDPGSGIYIPDYFDKTEFECVLTTVELEKSGKANYKIPEAELKRVQHILKNALDVEKGIVPKPEITEENPDGLDLSLYTSETQLERTFNELPTTSSKSSKKGNTSNTTKKSTTKKSGKRVHESEDEDDDDSDYIVLAKTVKTNDGQSAREVRPKSI